MPRAKHAVLSIVPTADAPRDPLAAKIDQLAMSMADDLMGQHVEIHEKIDGLKALAGYLAASRGKGNATPIQPEDAFASYRRQQLAAQD